VKIVGLNIDQGRLAISVVEKGLRQTDLKDSYNSTFATDEELIDILKAKAHDWTGARIVSSIPGRYCSQRLVKFPFADRKQVEKALPFEIEDSVPFALDSVVLDHLVMEKADKRNPNGNETTVLGILLPKTILRMHLDFLASAGLDAQVIVPSYVGLFFVANMISTEGTSILVSDHDLCLKEGKTIKACRSFSGSQGTAAIRHTLKALETEHGVLVDKAYLLIESESASAAFAELDIPVEQIVPEFGGKKAANPVSLGIALSEEINFRRGDFAFHLVDEGMRKRRRSLIFAGAAAALFVLANIGVKSYLTQSSYGKLDKEIKELYHQALPDTKLVGDPVDQLKRRIEEAKKKFGVLGSGTSALDVMKAVTDAIPKEVRVSFQEFLLEGDRLKLQGEASSFESVDKVKAELQKTPAFAEVQVLDTRMGVDNKVKFRFDIKLKQTM